MAATIRSTAPARRRADRRGARPPARRSRPPPRAARWRCRRERVVIQAATTSPFRMAAAMQAKTGRPAAKFAVPSTGSTTKARPAPPSRPAPPAWRRRLPRRPRRSPETGARAGLDRSLGGFVASVTRSSGPDFARTWPWPAGGSAAGSRAAASRSSLATRRRPGVIIGRSSKRARSAGERRTVRRIACSPSSRESTSPCW